jgi:hypothetical protein
MYYCIKDNETGNKARVSIFDLLWLKISLVLSLMVYGITVGTILVLIGVSYEVQITALVAVYFVELAGWLINKATPGKLVLAIIILIKWKSIFAELQIGGQRANKSLNKKEITDALNLCNSIDQLSHKKKNICL